MQTITKLVKSSTQTEKIAAAIGKQLKGGETIELVSDIGGGKTTFVRGLVKGTGSDDHVTSPTFTISNKYEAPHFDIYHFDFYRLAEAGLIEHDFHESLDMERDVTIVEWSDVVNHVLPDDRLRIIVKAKSDKTREFTFEAPEKLGYLLKNVDIKH